MDTVPISASAIRALLVPLLSSSLGLTEEDATATVDHLIRSEQSGKQDHGLIRIPYLLNSGNFGPYGGRSAREPELRSAGRIFCDGTGCLGYPVMDKLIRAGCDQAHRLGFCVATSMSVYPSGCLGDWARQACAASVGLILVANSPRRVTAPSSCHPLIGTNPLCIGLPSHPAPFVADSATSEITHGMLLLAGQSGAALPMNAAVDAQGHPTRDATQLSPAEGIGALLPVGGSHKVFALGMAVELLSNLSGEMPGSNKPDQHGIFAVFLGPQLFDDDLSTISTWLTEQEKVGVRIPGWTAFRRFQEQEKGGVVHVNRVTVEALGSCIDVSSLTN